MKQTVRIARRVYFASGHRYSQKSLSPEENLRLFGPCYTEHGHGHNYVLEAFFEGPIDARTGMVINLMDLDLILRDVVRPLDHHHLNFDVPEFSETESATVPTTENIARYCFDKTRDAIHGLPVHLYRVRLFENEDLWAEYAETSRPDTIQTSGSFSEATSGFNSGPCVELTRRYWIRALHNLQNPDVSDEENEQIYGMCYRLHGHDYQILVTIQAPIDAKTGLLLDRDHMDQIVRRELIEPFDGSNLNEIFPNTSGEALSLLFFDRLRPHFPAGQLTRLGIQETRKNWFGRNLQQALGEDR